MSMWSAWILVKPTPYSNYHKTVQHIYLSIFINLQVPFKKKKNSRKPDTGYIDITAVVNHFVPRSFRTQVISYLLWSFHTYFLVISYPVTTISYPGHFVPILVISYLGQLGTKWLYGGQIVPKSFRTLFGHFVPTVVISYPFCSFRTQQRWMDGWIDKWTDKRVLIEVTN